MMIVEVPIRWFGCLGRLESLGKQQLVIRMDELPNQAHVALCVLSAVTLAE